MSGDKSESRTRNYSKLIRGTQCRPTGNPELPRRVRPTLTVPLEQPLHQTREIMKRKTTKIKSHRKKLCYRKLLFPASIFFKVKEVRETNSITKLVDASTITSTDDDLLFQ